MPRVWEDALTERDKLVFSEAGYGRRVGFGERPALLIVDVNYNFVGEEPEPILESVKRFRNSCGEEGWRAVHEIQRLLSQARESGIPIFYSTIKARDEGLLTGRWGAKNARAGEDGENERNRIVAEIAPRPLDTVIEKEKPSCFFGTSLLSYLIYHNVDTLLVCGATTGGCVRATVVDAFSYNYKVGVIEECTFDRGETTHKINLFDMDSKYADVVSLDETLEYLGSSSSAQVSSEAGPLFGSAGTD